MKKQKPYRILFKGLTLLLITVLLSVNSASPVLAASYKKTTGIISSVSASSTGSITFKVTVPAHTVLQYEIFKPVHDNTHRGANDYSDSAVRKDYKLTGKKVNSTGKTQTYRITQKVYHYCTYSIFVHYSSGNYEKYEVRKNVTVSAPTINTWYSGWMAWSQKDYQRYKQNKTRQTVTYVVGNITFDLALAYTGAGIAKGAKDAVTVGSRIAKLAAAIAGWLKSGSSYLNTVRSALNGDGYLTIKSYMQQGQSTRLKFVRRSGGNIDLYIQGKNSSGKTTEKKIKTIKLASDVIIRMTPDDISAFDLN